MAFLSSSTMDAGPCLFPRHSCIQTRMWPRFSTVIVAALTLLGAGAASAAQPADNLAFADATRTHTVQDQASHKLTEVLSYEYRSLDENLQLARDKGTDQYVRQHTELLNKNRQTATKQKQTVATKVLDVGVRELTANSAKLLVFLDQTTTRGDTNKSSTVGFSAAVELKLLDGQWKLDSVSTTAAS